MNELSLAELRRLIGNLIRVGVVTQVDHLMTVARVQTGGLQTDWIRWGVDRAAGAVSWWAPEVGEPVILLAPDGALENAVIAFSLYSQAVQPPDSGKTSHVVRYPDGAEFSYDPASGALSETGLKSVFTDVGGTMTLNLGRLIINAGEIIVNGPVTQGGGNMSSNGVIVHTHEHTGVTIGDAQSGGPV